MFVLKGHYYISTEELLARLKDLNVPAIAVTFLNKSTENPSYLVHFPKDTINIFALNQQHKIIENLIIRWEKFNKSKKHITQCYNCQLFGHSAINCGRKFRCIKCLDQHEPGKCSRLSTEGTAKCVNCNGDHPANHTKCKTYISYKEKLVKPKTIKPTIRFFDSSPAPWINSNNSNVNSLHLNQINFPTIDKNARQQPKEICVNDANDHSNGFNLFELQNEFNSIPNINETMKLLKELINKLKSTNCQKTRIGLLLQYSMP